MILMDPTVSGIGYGLEYCYSVMERMRMAGLTNKMKNYSSPLFATCLKKCGSPRKSISRTMRVTWGTQKPRHPAGSNVRDGVALAGGDVIIMRHPEAIKLIKEMVADLTS